ncbi:MAG TPA: uridylate kinase [Methyloceanibacter sp.]|nr:uridylate kinase [Methyloceanibacter sp.]
MSVPASRAHASPVSHPAAAEPIVVKLGGSVIRSDALVPWLDAIAAVTRPIVIVPGGGALADEVRACQSQLGFGDRAAHRMALLAMDQLAWAVAGLRPGFAVGTTEAELRAVLGRGEVAVWAPCDLVAERSDLEASWRLTSDSLALWLAARLGAPRCYLIKSIERRAAQMSAGQLARDGVVDAAFPDMLRESGVSAILLGRGDQQSFAACLTGQAERCGAAIE